MTENTTTETTETTETAGTGNPILDALLATVADKVKAANDVAGKVAGATGEVNKTLKDWRETSEDPRAVAYRERLAKQQEAMLKERDAIDAIGKEILGVTVLTDSEVEKAKESYKDLAKVAREAVKTVEATAEMLGLTIPDGAMPSLLTFKGKAKAAGTGTGGRRLRFAEVKINGTVVDNLSKAALKITSDTGVKVTAGDLQEALFKEVGTDDVDKFPTDASILWSETKDGKTFSYEIHCIRKDKDGETVTTPEADATEADATE